MDITYKIEFFSNWHCGSGLAAGADVDALVVKDRNGLPYVPGRTLKGLLREAAEELYGDDEKALIEETFGIEGKKEGTAFFSDASLPGANHIASDGLAPYLYQTFASTAIDDNGIAKDNSLRKIETVVPCVVEGKITSIPIDEAKHMLENAMKYVKRMGTGRNRGYGRCKISSSPAPNANVVSEFHGNKLKFKCTLLSDIILSQTSSSEGTQNTLDFIPGNNFLGVVAAAIYDKVDNALDIFHSGKVRFGDAHPSFDGIRGLKVPAAMYYPKLGKASEQCYIHHLTNHQDPDIKNKQLKQCREGFYVFDESEKMGKPADVLKDFTIKSAYDSKFRRSENGKMFGYESLSKGLELYFEVESDLNEVTNKKIANALVGEKHIGRSRTAEYGLVKIENIDYADIPSGKPTDTFVTVYADGRLIFLDENGEPTLQPTAAQLLGIEEKESKAEIDWTKSQIRTFQYAPWNGKRHTYDTDRCGIEKGSVFVIDLNGETCPEKSQYVGAYKNEGFGKVIYNPAFLSSNGNGVADYKLAEREDTKPRKTPNAEPQEEQSGAEPQKQEAGVEPKSDLLVFLSKKRNAETDSRTIYRSAHNGFTKMKDLFEGKQFASQWGSIRNLAMIYKGQTLRDSIKGFLTHGVAQEKWSERGRWTTLKDFMETIDDTLIADVMINLASEMAKHCSNNKKGKEI